MPIVAFIKILALFIEATVDQISIPMKHALLCCLLALTAITSLAQLDASGGSYVGFTVDADTKTGFSKLGPATPSIINDDDWFSITPYAGRGRNVIDTSNSFFYKSQLAAGANINFTKRMSVPPYAVIPGFDVNGNIITYRFWADAIYFRDHAKTDKTAYTVAAKNGDNPNTWQWGTSSVSDKTDIVDAYTHVRTSGLSPQTDSVWFFAGVSTVGTSGARYFDIEVYREPISIDSTAGVFTSLGTDFGHSSWTFDASGNVTRTGDIIISVTYNNQGAPEIDFRIWVSQTSFNTVTPVNFKFGNKFYSAGGGFGYAEIVANSGSTQWGAGLGNYSSTAANDSTYATPWGTVNTAGNWSQNYEHLQMVEVALNFSRFGMNPFTYVTSFCKSPYSSIIIKSRNSPAFDASLNDFVGPAEFTVKNLAPFTITPDTLTCVQDTGVVRINATARNYYRWQAMDGTVLRADSDVPNYTVPAPGQYVVEATNFQGCPAMRRDTVTIPLDNHEPVASILLGSTSPYLQFIGGDEAASNYTTPFGGSAGLTYQWTGPDGWTSTEKDPIVNPYKEGTYSLTVTEKRNGCTDATATYMATLSNNGIQLQAQRTGDDVVLSWANPDHQQAWNFDIERSYDGTNFQYIGHVAAAANGVSQFTYRNKAVSGSTVYYRVKSRTGTSPVTISNIVKLAADQKTMNATITRQHNAVKVTLENCKGKVTIRVVDASGSLLTQQVMYPTQALQLVNLPVPAGTGGKPVIVSVFSETGLVRTQKLL